MLHLGLHSLFVSVFRTITTFERRLPRKVVCGFSLAQRIVAFGGLMKSLINFNILYIDRGPYCQMFLVQMQQKLWSCLLYAIRMHSIVPGPS